jgi:spore maturation protein CgeB
MTTLSSDSAAVSPDPMVVSPLPTLPRPPRRVLFFGKNMSRSRATGGLVEAFRAQDLTVRWLNLATLRRWMGRDLAIRFARRAFRRMRPDIVVVFCRDLPFALLREFGVDATTVVWVEEPLDNMAQDYVDYLAEADAVFMTNPSKLAWLRELGIGHANFVLEGYSPSFHYPVEAARPERDVVFIGGPGREGRRVEFLSRIAAHFDLEVYGRNWSQWVGLYPNLRVRGPVRPRGFRRLCATSRIVLGLNQVNRDTLYFSNRTFLTLACRGFHLTHYVPGLERVFDNDVHLAWYTDVDDCMESLAWYLERPEERARIADAGYRCVSAEHRFESRVRYILHVLRAGSAPQGSPSAAASPALSVVNAPVSAATVSE